MGEGPGLPLPFVPAPLLVGCSVIGINTDESGTVPNGSNGIAVSGVGTNGNTIGSTIAAADNIIGGNQLSGVLVQGGASGTTVRTNTIGTDDLGGTHDFGNGTNGNVASVLVQTGANGSVIATNVVTHGRGKGIVIGQNAGDTTTIGNTLSQNRIFANAGLGIDLANDGVTANGANPRPGPNQLQNYPALTMTVGTTQIAGALNSTPSHPFTIEFFAATTRDASGHGGANSYLGNAMVMTTGSGVASFTATVGTLPTTGFVTATATDTMTGDSSEFALDIPVVPITLPGTVPNGLVGMSYSATLMATGGAGGPYTYTISGGMLPPGLMLATSGQISGTPTQPGAFMFMVHVTDSASDAADLPVTLLVHATPTVAVTSSSPMNTSTLGQSVTFTVTVTGAGGVTPTGTVSFTSSDGTMLTAQTLVPVGGMPNIASASVTTSALKAGADTITANYGGDTLYLTGTGMVTQTVVAPVTLSALTVTAPTGSGSNNNGTAISPVLRPGASFTLNVVGTFSNGTMGPVSGLVFTVDNGNVVTVDPMTGKVTGVAPGTATITVTAPNGVKTTISVTVTTVMTGGLTNPNPAPMVRATAPAANATPLPQPNRTPNGPMSGPQPQAVGMPTPAPTPTPQPQPARH